MGYYSNLRMVKNVSKQKKNKLVCYLNESVHFPEINILTSEILLISTKYAFLFVLQTGSYDLFFFSFFV